VIQEALVAMRESRTAWLSGGTGHAAAQRRGLGEVPRPTFGSARKKGTAEEKA